MPWVLTWSESVVIALHRAADVELPVELAHTLAVWEGFFRMLRRGLEDRVLRGPGFTMLLGKGNLATGKRITFQIATVPNGKDPK